MKSFVRNLFVLSSVLAFALPAHSQEVCAGYQAVFINCSGPNNCNQGVPVIRPYFGSASTCLEETFVSCCSTQIVDYNDTGVACSDVCDDAVKALLRDSNASEFSLTHTLWAKDCSGRYRPFARSWDAPEKPINLRLRLALSGI